MTQTPGTSVSSPSKRAARLAVALLLAINLFNYIDRYVLAAVESQIGKELLPGDPNQLAKLGMLVPALIISYMLSAPIFGYLADRMSRWLLVGVGVTLWTLASGGSGLATSFSMLLITRLFIGVGEGAYGPAAPTIIADLFPVARRGQVMAWFYMAIPVGSALGYMLGGPIAAIGGWRWAFYAVVPPGLALGAFCFLMRDPPRGLADANAPVNRRPGFNDYLQLLKTPSYVLDCAGMTAMTFAIGGISFWMPRWISEVRHAGDLAHVNFVFGLITVIAGITATLLGGFAGDYFRKYFSGSYFLVSGVAIMIACPAVIAMTRLPFPHAWVAVFVAEFFLFFNTGPANTILANVTHPSVRATAFALNILLIHALGDALSPPVLGAVAEHFSWNAAFALVVANMFLAAVLWLLGVRYLKRDTDRVSAIVPGFPVVTATTSPAPQAKLPDADAPS